MKPAEVDALVASARDAFDRFTPGQCKWLSERNCRCLKCVADALVLVTAQRDALAAAAPAGEAERQAAMLDADAALIEKEAPGSWAVWSDGRPSVLYAEYAAAHRAGAHALRSVPFAEAERQAFRAGFMAVWHRDDSWTFNGPSAADKEPAAWAAWEAQNRPEARVDADAAALAAPAPPADPVAAPPADLVALVREWQHWMKAMPDMNDSMEYIDARIDEAEIALLAFPLPEVPK